VQVEFETFSAEDDSVNMISIGLHYKF
jgi:hypothetical protein